MTAFMRGTCPWWSAPKKLVQDDGQLLWIDAEGRDDRLHARHVPMVGRSPHVYHPVKSPIDELVVVVRDVCREVRRPTTPGPDHNVVYYVQYAHARIQSILRAAAEQGIDFSDGDLQLLRQSQEAELAKKILDLPEIVAIAAKKLDPTALPYYAYELARVFQAYYENKDECRVLSEDPTHLPLSKARLKLVDAARIALANTLGLMGMSAPERM